MKFLKFAIVLCIFITNYSFAQISNFTLQVTKADETCLGNGSLSFSVSGTTPGATMSYAIYLLPNTTTPVAVVTSSQLGGLNAGTYLVIATQSLGGQSGTQQATVTIQNLIQQLTYTLSSQNEKCGYDGKITVNVVTGVGALYEIISGPVIVSPQASNVFNNLTAGVYQIRVYDNCGDAVVQSYTLLADTLSIVIDSVTFPVTILPTCNTITVANFYGSINPGIVSYPLTVEYTVFPPGGGTPILFTQILPIGANSGTLWQDIPFYNGQSYSYNLKITDSCGIIYTRNNNIVFKSISLGVAPALVTCDGISLKLVPSLYMPPYTISFIQSPPGFNATQANGLHPGPFSTDSVDYGSSAFPLPQGVYIIQITDACGRSATVTTDVDLEHSPPALGIPQTCESTSITITALPPAHLVSVVLISAPSAYPNTLPHNLSSLISGANFQMTDNIFVGNYVFQVVDSCGGSYTLSGNVQLLNSFSIEVSQRPGCDIGFGGARIIASVEEPLLSAKIINAPASFSGTLPLNVTSNISPTGVLDIGNIPAGVYTFQFEYMCGSVLTIATETVTIVGYQVTNNNLTVIEHCGSFDLQLQHTSNGVVGQTFWLQKQNPVTGEWGHPLTGSVFLPGTLPSTINSKQIFLNIINLNIAASGHFRVMKRFQSFTQAGGIANCLSVLDEFDFNDGPSIIDVYSFLCANGNLDTIILAEGVPPLTYSITEKNGVPFVVNNSNSALFLNLQPANYNFQIQDACGNIANSLFEINALPPLEVDVSQMCNGQNGSLSVPNFPFITYQWWKASDPLTILSTTNELNFSPFNSGTQSGQYFVSIASQNSTSCINQTLSITVDGNSGLPNAGQNVNPSVCEGGELIDLFAYFTSYDSGGIWTDLSNTGALTGSTVNTSLLVPGSFQYRYTVTDSCNQVAQAIITLQIKPIPSLPIISAISPVCEGEQIQLTTPTIVGATYHWEGPNGFDSNVQNPIISSANLQNGGDYTLYVSLNGCNSEVSLSSIEVAPKPAFSIQGELLICNNQNSTLTVNPLNFTADQVSFNWYLNGTFLETEPNGVLEINQAGFYSVEVSLGICAETQQIEIVERVIDIPIVFEEKCIDNRKTLAVANADQFVNYTFDWTGPGGFTAQGATIDISGMPTGYYAVTVTDPMGCFASLEINVLKTNCTIPKGISPNGDGMNDSFDLSEFNVQNLKIFNRYGLKMYEQDNYLNQWEGQTDSGDLLPSATYYYLVYFTDGSHKTGWVYLTRENSR